MASENETLADIIADMRCDAKLCRDAWLKDPKENPQADCIGVFLDSYARRIEAAANRDYEYPKSQSLDADKLTGKTISELTTDLRQISKYHYARGNIEQGQFCRVMADRLDAAWKRERDAITAEKEHFRLYGLAEHNKVLALKSSPVGSAAPMREALEDFSRTMYNEALYNCTEKAMIGKYDNTQLSLCKSCVARGCECWQMTLAREAKTALAAPARNCDRFGSEIDAQIVFLNEVWLISVDESTMLERDRFENWTDEMRSAYAKWLLAPAAERNRHEQEG